MTAAAPAPIVSAAPGAAAHRPVYAWYVTLVLLLAYTLSFVDRQILGLLVQPIKRDLGLSDAAFSIVHGFAFAVFYTFIGVLLGRVADRRNRRNLIVIGIVVWILATAAGAYVTSFFTLFLARVFVGVGEASLSPAAYSMLADYFPPHKRARAMSVYTAGVYIGSAAAFIVGGMVIAATSQASEVVLPLLGSFRPWQAAFIIVALPGLLAIALMLTVREPARREQQASAPAPDLSHLRGNLRVYAALFLANGVIAMITFGITAWLPATFIRQWGWTPGQIGPVYGVIILTCGIGGMLLSGYLADRLALRGRGDAALLISLAGALVLIATSLLFAFAPSPTIALVAIALTTFFLGMPVALAPSILQAVTPNRLRGQVTSIYLLLVNLIGLGLGPFLVAAGTDYVLGDEHRVGLSLGMVCTLSAAIGALCLMVAARPYRALLRSSGAHA
ncbi:spinster family MFS transporter [Pseudoxanthomonas winnipegensis]|uniref:spinster family MFS transporter n=1 Tax=Pseudoxanthomonas winnipegensis TaxID=2480810 RepID=UPI00103B9E4B|nr:MFS transporter [Pseudoxanthomonas winnipegensis]TBV77108.1 MFS transporter [Pseudoxanthomonas winnipegensis]